MTLLDRISKARGRTLELVSGCPGHRHLPTADLGDQPVRHAPVGGRQRSGGPRVEGYRVFCGKACQSLVSKLSAAYSSELDEVLYGMPEPRVEVTKLRTLLMSRRGEVMHNRHVACCPVPAGNVIVVLPDRERN